MLQQALTLSPKLAKTHFFLGTVLKTLRPLRRGDRAPAAAAAQYPRDRVVLNQLGRVLFLQRQYRRRPSPRFRQVLPIDPEDLQAHYNLMLCYQRAGQHRARGARTKLYERFKADESAQAITGPYRQLHADDNNERQSDPRARRAVTRKRDRRIDRRPGHASAEADRDAETDNDAPGSASLTAMLRRRPRRIAAGARRRCRPSPTSPRRRASASTTTTAPSARSTCPRRWGRARAFLDADGDGWQDLLLRQLDELAGAAGAPVGCRRCTATITTARSPTSRARRGARRRTVRHRRVGRRLRQRRHDRHLRHGARRQPPVPQPRRRQVRRRHRRRPASADGGFSTSAAWFDYDNDGRLDLFVAHYVAVVDRERPVLHARRQDEVVLHAGVLQGPEPDALPQPRRRHVRGRDASGPASTTRRRRGWAWRILDYDGDGWIDLFVANDTQPNRLYRNTQERHVHRRRAWRPASRSTKRAWRAPAWASMPPTTTARDGRAWSSATSRTR